jgi:hypothetical protein
VRAICITCGVQFADEAPERCPICDEPRQYVPQTGQAWTTLERLRDGHANTIRPEGELTGIGTEPRFAIGQRALLVPTGSGGNILWDCITLLDEATAREVEQRGGIDAIAISHPHYYSAMVEWAHAFGCPVWLHEDDARHVVRRDEAIRFWSGETHDLGGGVTLVRCGGHFAGGQVLHWAERHALLSGDIVMVIPDRRYVSFMYSYPNLIPLPPARVQAIGAALAPFEFETIHGAWWDRVVRSDGSDVVRRSIDRYVRAITERGLPA